jgi:hypothetical protein
MKKIGGYNIFTGIKWKCNICKREGRKYQKKYLAIKSVRTHSHRYKEGKVDAILIFKNGEIKPYKSTWAKGQL